MKVYGDGDVIGVAISDGKKIVIFDTVEGESPAQFFDGEKWESFFPEEMPEDVYDLICEANEILSADKEENIDELPKDVLAIIKKEHPEFPY